jgi:DNA-binding MarR family transcriptional regulator
VAQTPDRFDPVLVSPVRLSVICVLMSRPEATFSDLKSLLDLTQGNLGIHLKKLEEAKYIQIKKEFVRNKPRTSCRITVRGRKAFLDHVEQLEKVARKDPED